MLVSHCVKKRLTIADDNLKLLRENRRPLFLQSALNVYSGRSSLRAEKNFRGMTKTIPELVESFVNGDQSSFAELVARFRRKIYNLAFQLLGNHLDADEVVQETFVRIYKRREELRSVTYFSTFLMRIATNYAIDMLRRRKGHSSIPDDSVSLRSDEQVSLSKRVATPVEMYEQKRLMEEIGKALELLPPRQRLTAILHDIEGYTKAEIAAIFDCPQATVRSNLHIARTKLKKILRQRLRIGEQE